MGPCGDVAEARMVSRSARPLQTAGVTRLEAGTGDAEVVVEAEAEAKRVSMVNLPFAGVGAGEAVGKYFKNNLSISDAVPLMASV
jgi:hypothetical protein